MVILRGIISSILLLVRHGFLLLLLHYVVVGLDESEVDIVGAANIVSYDLFLLTLDVVDGYAKLLMERVILIMVFVVGAYAVVELSVSAPAGWE